MSSGVSLTIKALMVPSPVTAIVASRIYPFPLPPSTALPAIAIALSTETEDMLLAGASQYPQTTVQVHCIASKMSSAIELGEEVKDHLRDLHFVAGTDHASFEKDSVDFSDYNDDLTTHRRVMSFNLRWRSSA